MTLTYDYSHKFKNTFENDDEYIIWNQRGKFLQENDDRFTLTGLDNSSFGNKLYTEAYIHSIVDNLKNTTIIKVVAPKKSNEYKIYGFDTINREDVGITMAEQRKSHNSLSDNKQIISDLTKVFEENKNKMDSISIGDFIITRKDNYDHLKNIEHQVENAIDEIMYETALERKDEVANIPLSRVIEKYDLDVSNIYNLIDQLEDDE
ncbi:hypothetical protein [Bacillus sp. E(2018)]|uniref:hypothetical protein n=1 Tax=Bacillus sp. E(2018) TaxID=2502239 RepID=UPI0010F5A29F|nr:hypothetical protein [Bacillus sp. E(2018)]